MKYVLCILNVTLLLSKVHTLWMKYILCILNVTLLLSKVHTLCLEESKVATLMFVQHIWLFYKLCDRLRKEWPATP